MTSQGADCDQSSVLEHGFWKVEQTKDVNEGLSSFLGVHLRLEQNHWRKQAVLLLCRTLQSSSNTVAVIARKLRNCRIVRTSISPFSMDIKRNWIKLQPLFGSNCVNRGHAIRHRPEANRLVDARSSAIMCPDEPHLLPCYPCPPRRCS